MRAAGIAAAVLALGATHGQHPTLDPSLISAGTTEFIAYLVRNGAEQPFGTATETVRRIDFGGKAALLREWTMRQPNRTIVDTAISDRATLWPVLHRSHQPDMLMDLQFNGATVVATLTPKDSAARRQQTTYTGPMFDSNSIEQVLAAMDLHSGLRDTLPFYIQEQGGYVRIPLAVVDTAPPASARGRPAWAVRLEYPGSPATYWIDRRSRRVVAEEFNYPGGTTWRIVRVSSTW